MNVEQLMMKRRIVGNWNLVDTIMSKEERQTQRVIFPYANTLKTMYRVGEMTLDIVKKTL